jgi:hypothetical protein
MQRDGAPGADRSHRGFRTPTLADWRRMSHCARNVSIDADATRADSERALLLKNAIVDRGNAGGMQQKM